MVCAVYYLHAITDVIIDMANVQESQGFLLDRRWTYQWTSVTTGQIASITANENLVELLERISLLLWIPNNDGEYPLRHLLLPHRYSLCTRAFIVAQHVLCRRLV